MVNLTVTAKVMGSSAQVFEDFSGATIAELQDRLGLTGNYTYNLGGQPATKDSVLNNGSYVVFAPSVKGAISAISAMAVKKPSKPMPKPSKPSKPTKKGC